jgi:hypothetical protein
LSAEIALLRMLVLRPKIHSLSPDVECVGRDKADGRYEFGGRAGGSHVHESPASVLRRILRRTALMSALKMIDLQLRCITS